MIEFFKNQYVEAAIIFILFVVIAKTVAVVLKKYVTSSPH